MAALDPSKFQDMNTYHFLVIWKLTTEPVATVGDQEVSGLGYWNDADPSASEQAGKNECNNLLLYCLTYAGVLGTQWIDSDESKRLVAATQLATIMSTAASLVSDISTQLGKIFSFTSSAIPTPYASHFAQTTVRLPGASSVGAAVVAKLSGSAAAGKKRISRK